MIFSIQKRSAAVKLECGPVTALHSEPLQLAQIGDAVGQRRDPLHQRQSRLPHRRILGHHQHIGEKAVDRRLKNPQNLAQTPDNPLARLAHSPIR